MSKIYDGIMGVIVGDALGVPVEFKKRDTFTVTDMIGYGTYNQPPGTWSDDSSMTLATVESIAHLNGRIDTTDIMRNFVRWFENAEFTPYNKVFDVGNTTRKAIQRFKTGVPAKRCGFSNEYDCGNGSLMRILPVIFAEFGDGDNVRKISSLTHAHPDCIKACEIYYDIAEGLAGGDDLKTAMGYAAFGSLKNTVFNRLENLETISRENIRSSGYVVDTLEAAIWCLLKTNNYRDCVLTAVNLGEDTDTVAAVAGGLAGLLYGVGGESGIPESWINQLARKDWIEKLISNLETAIDED